MHVIMINEGSAEFSLRKEGRCYIMEKKHKKFYLPCDEEGNNNKYPNDPLE